MGLPPLYYAVKYSNYDAAKLLIEHGANIDLRIDYWDCQYGWSDCILSDNRRDDSCLLNISVNNNDVRMTELLLCNGVHIPKHSSIMLIAIRKGNIPMIELLYRYDTNHRLNWDYEIHCDEHDHWNCHCSDCVIGNNVNLALDMHDIDVLRAVIKHGSIDVSYLNYELQKSYDRQASISIIKTLLEVGADINTISRRVKEQCEYHQSIYELI